MRLFISLVLLAAMALAVPALADPSAGELAAASAAEARGAEIYAYDQAAWHSTDQRQTAKALGLSYDQLRHAMKKHELLERGGH